MSIRRIRRAELLCRRACIELCDDACIKCLLVALSLLIRALYYTMSVTKQDEGILSVSPFLPFIVLIALYCASDTGRATFASIFPSSL
jgi:hypothetical protein